MSSRKLLCHLAKQTVFPSLTRPSPAAGHSSKVLLSPCAKNTLFVIRNFSALPSVVQDVVAASPIILPTAITTPVRSDVAPALPHRTLDTPVVLSNATDTLTIQQGHERVEVPLLWLRDSCVCGRCVDSRTSQRKSWTIAVDATLAEAEVVDGVIRTVWTDGHESQHGLEHVKRTFKVGKDSPLVRRHTWKRHTWRGLPLPIIPHADVLTDTGLRDLLANVHRFGFGLVDGCGVSEDDTEMLVRRVGAPMPTTFSPGMWTFTSNMERGDTAYGSDYLAPHTDTTYFSNPARIQVFHCLVRDGCEGGETILVDGFQCAEKLQHDDPTVMETLSTIAQECVYVEPGICYKWTDTVFSTSKIDQSLERLRFNMYDRSTTPPICPIEDVNHFYSAVKKMADLTQSRENQLLLTLRPGLVVFIDNWRVMHGRTEFVGKRVLTGCYMDSDEFNHACRKFNVIP